MMSPMSMPPGGFSPGFCPGPPPPVPGWLGWNARDSSSMTSNNSSTLPYSRPAPSEITVPLTDLPPPRAISTADAAGLLDADSTR